MKTLFLCSFLLILGSCFGPDLKVGDCIQKPDESSVWKIENFEEGKAEISPTNKNSNLSIKEVSLPGSYIKTRCR